MDEAEDAELYLRHEVQAAPPDLLMTNYSMLEYMLLRPIERSIWATARQRFRDAPDDRLLLVLDEGDADIVDGVMSVVDRACAAGGARRLGDDLVDRWFAARKLWNKELRVKLQSGEPYLDSPAHCWDAAARAWPAPAPTSPASWRSPTRYSCPPPLDRRYRGR